MSETFKELLLNIQIDMLDICFEYANKNAEKIYVYCSYEQDSIFCNFFYLVKGGFLKKHKLDVDVSPDRQRKVLKILNNDVEKIIELCKENKEPMPTEIKIVYDVQSKSLSTDYKYNLVHY